MKKKIGLLGGSFNPPHAGHLDLSLKALNKLQLNEVWWIIALNNPLKETPKNNSFSTRFNQAVEYTSKYSNIIISDLEKKTNLNYSIDTIKKIKHIYRKNEFVWLMGADNFFQFHNWRDWHEIINSLPIAIFNRPGYSHKSLSSKAAIYYKNKRKKNSTKLFVSSHPPSWHFVWDLFNNISSSQIRKSK